MNEVLNIIETLKTLQGTNRKINYLSQHQNNNKLKVILKCAYSPYIVFGISESKYQKAIKSTIIDEQYLDYSFIDLLRYLKDHNTGRDKDLKVLTTFLSKTNKIKNKQLREEMKNLTHDIVTKKLRIGMNTKNINKAFDIDLIPEFQLQLAHKYEPKRIPVGASFAVTEKIDGVRCIMIKHNGRIQFFSRQGKEFTGLVELIKEMQKIKGDVVLDGELQYNGDCKITLLYKKTTEVVGSKETRKTGIKYRLFDVLTYKEWTEKTQTMDYKYRYEILKAKIDCAEVNPNLVEVLPHLYNGKNVLEIENVLREVTSVGKEGVMVNLNNASYDFKRTYNLMKVKAMQDCDLKVIGTKEGDGKYTNTLGALICEYKGETVDVGSGFKESDRHRIWKKREQIIGKIIQVQYFEETEDSSGKKSLRFPVFKRIRTDKTEPSYN